MSINLEDIAIEQIRAIRAAASASQCEVEILVDAAKQFKKEDIGSYLLVLTQEIGATMSEASLKVKKSNTKLLLEFALGARKEQSEWTEDQVQAALSQCMSSGNSLATVAQACRQSLKDGDSDSSSEDKPEPTLSERVAKYAEKLVKAGADRQEVIQALRAAAKAI
jgi:uncharacterized protein YoaH (UPF0181 family)